LEYCLSLFAVVGPQLAAWAAKSSLGPKLLRDQLFVSTAGPSVAFLDARTIELMNALSAVLYFRPQRTVVSLPRHSRIL
jgi:hypothetical protein